MVTISAVTFSLSDPRHRLAGARLRTDLRIGGDALDPHLTGLLRQVCG